MGVGAAKGLGNAPLFRCRGERFLRASRRKEERAASDVDALSECRVAWNSIATAALLPSHRCRSDARADRALADAWSSSIPVVWRSTCGTLASEAIASAPMRAEFVQLIAAA
jgi:hypothetical protein